MVAAALHTKSRETILAHRRSASLSIKAAAIPSSGVAAGTFGSPLSNLESQSQHREQLRHLRDWVYVAIRPIANRFASQEFRVGYLPTAKPNESRSIGDGRGKLRTKSLAEGSAEELELLDSHPLMDAIENPNDVFVQFQLMWFLAASLSVTGRGLWWLVQADDQLQIWPIPPSWVTRIDARNASGKFQIGLAWKVRPPGVAEGWAVPGEDMCEFMLLNPADPLSALSPLQSVARAVDQDTHIQNSRLSSYKQGIKPSVILKAGRLKTAQGMSGMRPVLTPAQRKQLTTAVRLAWGGTLNHGSAAIVDGLIEDIVPWDRSPSEMDWLNSEKSTKDRIMQGIGTSPIMAGQDTNANRAGSWVSEYHFLANTVNPLIRLVNQVCTKRLSPRYAVPEGKKLAVQIPLCRPLDPELDLARMEFAVDTGIVTVNEVRGFMGLPDRDADGDMLISEFRASQPQQPPGRGATSDDDSIPLPSTNGNGRKKNRRLRK